MIVHDLNNILYIEDAFPGSANFIETLEDLDSHTGVHSVIPQWSRWDDGAPVALDKSDPTKWQQVFDGLDSSHRGDFKLFDWDLSVNHDNTHWPRIAIPDDYTSDHVTAYQAVSIIEKDLLSVIDFWCSKTGLPKLNYVTRNYCVRKYRTGGSMGVHVDRNVDNPLNTMDWTALIYLNDDYEGGEIVFPNLDIEIKPSAGSVIFLPCLEEHWVKEIKSGNKYYIFLFLHLNTLMCTSLGEPYQGLNEAINDYRQKQVTTSLEV